MMHTACEIGLPRLVEHLLSNGADANVQSSWPATNDVYGQTPMHKVMTSSGNQDMIDIFIKYKATYNFNLVYSNKDTVLSLALFNNLFEIAR